MSEREHSVDRRRFIQGVTAGAAGLALSGAAARDALARDEEPKRPGTGLVKQRPLGKTGIQASVIAYGCGGTTTQHMALLKTAYERGINLYDVAWGYQRGQAEVAVGQFLKSLKDRESVCVITKTTGWKQPSGSSKQVYKSLREGLTKSLQRLQTDYVDVLYSPHGATSPQQVKDKALEDALALLVEEKLVRHAGASSHTNYQAVGEQAVKDSFCEVFMPVANICTQNPDRAGQLPSGGRRRRGIEDTRGVLETAAKRKVGLVAMKVANPGYLTDRTDALLAEAFPAESPLSRHQKLYTWMLNQEGVSSVVVGIRSVLHLREAIAVGVA